MNTTTAPALPDTWPPSQGDCPAPIEDYLWVGGPRMSLTQVAARLHVTTRTVSRWRQELAAAVAADAALEAHPGEAA